MERTLARDLRRGVNLDNILLGDEGSGVLDRRQGVSSKCTADAGEDGKERPGEGLHGEGGWRVKAWRTCMGESR